MSNPRRRSCLVFCVNFLFLTSSFAANRVVLSYRSSSQLPSGISIIMPGDQRSMRLSGHALKYLRHHEDRKHMLHVRMQQQYQGVPVYGAYAIFHTKASLKSLSLQPSGHLTGVLYEFLEKDLGRPPSNYALRGQQALDYFKVRYSKGVVTEENVTPLIYVKDQHQPVWAYKVSFFEEHPDAPPQRPTALVDAETFEPIIFWNDIKFMRASVRGQGYGGNYRMGKIVYGQQGWPFLNILRDDLTEMCFMVNDDVQVVDMAMHYSGPNVPMEFSCRASGVSNGNVYWTGYDGDGYDEVQHAYSPTNDALNIGNTIRGMYRDWYDVSPLSTHGKSQKLVMRVHYGKRYENAFWDGKQMTFGDGDKLFYPLVSLGVGAHEISHGFTEQHSGLEYYGQSGGIDESFSDMASNAAEYYAYGKNHWLIGDDIVRENSGMHALRYMEHPSLDGHSIERADQYKKNMNVHYLSGVYNRFFYLLAHLPDWDTKKAFDVMIKANMDYWIPTSTFEDAACGILYAAKDLNINTDDISAVFEQVAIPVNDCSVASLQ